MRCRHSRTPVDEALGRPFQDSVVEVINSFFKQPLVEVEQMQEEDEEDNAGVSDQEMEVH